MNEIFFCHDLSLDIFFIILFCQWGILIAKILNVKLILMKSHPDKFSSNWPVDKMRNGVKGEVDLQTKQKGRKKIGEGYYQVKQKDCLTQKSFAYLTGKSPHTFYFGGTTDRQLYKMTRERNDDVYRILMCYNYYLCTFCESYEVLCIVFLICNQIFQS